MPITKSGAIEANVGRRRWEMGTGDSGIDGCRGQMVPFETRLAYTTEVLVLTRCGAQASGSASQNCLLWLSSH